MNDKLDYFGQQLLIGDIVSIMEPNYRNFVTAKIVNFTPQKIRVIFRRSNNTKNSINDFICYPQDVVKAPQEWLNLHSHVKDPEYWK